MLLGLAGGCVRARANQPSTRCHVDSVFELEGREYQGSSDGYTSWWIAIELAQQDPIHGTLRMVGDGSAMHFAVRGHFTPDCVLDLEGEAALDGARLDRAHLTFDPRSHGGTVESDDRIWVLGPPFSPAR